MATFGKALDYARQLLGTGDLVQAEVIYRRLIEAVPRAAEPWHELGILQLQANRAEESLESLRQAVLLDPQVPAYHINLAAAYRRLGQPGAAIACFEQVLKLAPPTAELLNNLAVTLKDAGRTDAALQAFDDALRLRPRYANASFNRGNLLLSAGRLEEAVTSYQRTIELEPADPYAHCQLGLVYCQLSRANSGGFAAAGAGGLDRLVSTKQTHLAQAIALFRRALDLHGDYAEAQGNLDAALAEQSKLNEAADGCRRALALAEQGQCAEAVACLQRVLECKPDFVEAHYRLGVIWAELNQADMAIACHKQAIAFDPSHADAIKSLAAALMQRDRPAEAEAWLRQVLTQQPDCVEARKNLQLAREQIERLDQVTAGKQRGARFLNLQAAEKQVYSQNGEDGVIESLFAELGTTNKFFVEFGCGNASECNGARLREQGWTGLQMDGQNRSTNPLCTIEQEFITVENINDLFRKYQVPVEFDLLSIDIDGNDFWVWRQITARPRVVVIEYNACVPPHERLSIAYDPRFGWDGSDFYGASLLALKELGERKGYTLVYCERAGVNAFFVASDALPEGFQPRSIEEIYRLPNFFYWGIRHRPETTRTMIDPFADSR